MPTDAPTMKALRYHGPGRNAWEDATKPVLINDSDAITYSTPKRIVLHATTPNHIA